jgi:hypothetical protein
MDEYLLISKYNWQIGQENENRVTRPVEFDKEAYRRRNIVEPFTEKIKKAAEPLRASIKQPITSAEWSHLPSTGAPAVNSFNRTGTRPSTAESYHAPHTDATIYKKYKNKVCKRHYTSE